MATPYDIISRAHDSGIKIFQGDFILYEIELGTMGHIDDFVFKAWPAVQPQRDPNLTVRVFKSTEPIGKAIEYKIEVSTSINYDPESDVKRSEYTIAEEDVEDFFLNHSVI